MKKFAVVTSLLFFAALIHAQTAGVIQLPQPDLKSGKPLMQCAAERRSGRKFSAKALPAQMISEILYVADGINRKDGRKTVPTARNKQNQSVYAVTADGIYFYNSKKHALELFLKGDFRKECGTQPFHKKAPLILLFVADLSAIGKTPAEQALYAGNHAGYSSQNVYLYAASKDLSTVVCGMLNRDALKKRLNLKKDQMVIFSQPIGFPAR